MGEEMGEVARDFEQVALLAEHHEGARGRHILEGDVPAEFVRRQAHARRAADLHGRNVARAAILEHLLDAHAEWVFVEPGPRAIARHRQDLGARRAPRSAPGERATAIERNFGRLRERLDVVDHRRLAEIADGHRERRSNARLAGLAFERLDQRRFLAADIGARPEMDIDVEVETLRSAYAGAEKPVAAHRLELRPERLQEMPVFPAQIEKPARRADHEARDRHSLEHPLGVRRKQHPVLERSRLAFVGVADYEAVGSGRIAAALPFDRSREARAAAAAQVRALHFVEHPLTTERDRSPQRGTPFIARAEQGVGAADIVLDAEIVRRPFGDRYAAAHKIADLVDAVSGEARHRAVVDEGRGPLIAHAGA